LVFHSYSPQGWGFRSFGVLGLPLKFPTRHSLRLQRWYNTVEVEEHDCYLLHSTYCSAGYLFNVKNKVDHDFL
jgi:hypothetical protein